MKDINELHKRNRRGKAETKAVSAADKETGSEAAMTGLPIGKSNRHALQELVGAKELLERMFSSVNILVAYMDSDFNFLRVNRTYAEADAHSPDFFVGKNHFALYPNDENKATFRKVAETGEPFFTSDMPFTYPEHPERGVTYWDWSLQPVKDGQGKVQGLVLSLNDVSERKQAQEALRLANAYNRSLIEASLDPLVTIGPDGKITDVNAATEAATGCLRKELIGTDFSEYFTDPVSARAGYEQVFREGLVRDYGLELRHRDGHTTSVLYNASVYRNESGQVIGVFAAARDITERKRAAEIDSQLAAIVESSDDAIISKTLAGHIASWNGGAERLYGYRADEVIGQPISILLPPQKNDELSSILEQVKVGENINHLQTTRVTKDGRLVDVSLTISPIKDAAGQIIGASTIAHDMSERVRYEKEILRLNAELEQRVAERTAQLNETNRLLVQAKDDAERANNAKSDFLSRMSHELRTPLNSILGFAQLMEMYALHEQPDELDDTKIAARQTESLDQILKAGRHLLDLINEVLEISRIESGRLSLSPEPILISEITSESVDLIRPLAAHKDLSLVTELGGMGGCYVTADRQRLKEVFLNLLSNAVKFNRRNGRISLICEEIASGKWLRVNIRDTGRGIAPEMLPRIFTPFERLGAERSGIEGTGLGLALSKHLAEAMGGKIGVESVLGSGSNFWVELPLTEGPLEKAVRENGGLQLPAVDGRKKKYTVLYVEDNFSNLSLIKRLLEFRSDIRLLSAMQGGLGIELAREYKPHLILLDLNLPDIPGLDVLHRLQADSATCNIPVVIISADAMPGQIKRLEAAGAREYLTKPLDVKKFIAVMDEILSK